MGKKPLKSGNVKPDDDDAFHSADTEELATISDDTDVLETLEGDEEHAPDDNPGFDPYNNSREK